MVMGIDGHAKREIELHARLFVSFHFALTDGMDNFLEAWYVIDLDYNEE